MGPQRLSVRGVRSLAAEHANVLAMPERNPNRHLLLDAFQRRLVHNAMALGRALKRKVSIAAHDVPRLHASAQHGAHVHSSLIRHR